MSASLRGRICGPIGCFARSYVVPSIDESSAVVVLQVVGGDLLDEGVLGVVRWAFLTSFHPFSIELSIGKRQDIPCFVVYAT